MTFDAGVRLLTKLRPNFIFQRDIKFMNIHDFSLILHSCNFELSSNRLPTFYYLVDRQISISRSHKQIRQLKV